jgi:hypothetical protein
MNIELIGIKPTDQPIDLSQALSLQNQVVTHPDGTFAGYSGEPRFDMDFEKPRESTPEQLMRELKALVSGLLEKQTAVVDKTLGDSLQLLANNINPVLNDQEARLVDQAKQIDILETVLASFIRLWLVADTMPESELTDHQNILTNFLQSTATITVDLPDAQEESTKESG